MNCTKMEPVNLDMALIANKSYIKSKNMKNYTFML